MKLNFVNIVEILFPSTDDEKIIRVCTTDAFRMKLEPTHIQGIHALSSFTDKEIRAAIHLNKFHNHVHAKKLLAALVQQWLVTQGDTEYILIPIPLSTKREKERGYNQVTVVVKEAVRGLPHSVLTTDVLVRNKDTPPQTSLNKQQRKSNLKGAFTVPPEKTAMITQKRIILIDDVTTTGATLTEAVNALRQHSPKSIICIAFAH